MSRLRVDHTGLNSTLFLMGKRNSENCEKCGVKENTEHVILQCNWLHYIVLHYITRCKIYFIK